MTTTTTTTTIIIITMKKGRKKENESDEEIEEFPFENEEEMKEALETSDSDYISADEEDLIMIFIHPMDFYQSEN